VLSDGMLVGRWRLEGGSLVVTPGRHLSDEEAEALAVEGTALERFLTVS
jgi:hypothetical protein